MYPLNNNCIESGIIGPSGAGKSTLLNCVTGRYTDFSGQVFVSSSSPPVVTTDQMTNVRQLKLLRNSLNKKSNLKISFIPQKDHLFGQFTVKETLMFASRIKNQSTSSEMKASLRHKNIMASLEPGSSSSAIDPHEAEAVKVIHYLNLESCAKTLIKKCSGGQVKRVCIGVELVSRPDLLVLDEPTTGLDSSTAYQCVSILRKLVNQTADGPTTVPHMTSPPAILATIHQPSWKILKVSPSILSLNFTHSISFSSLSCHENNADDEIGIPQDIFVIENWSMSVFRSTRRFKRPLHGSRWPLHPSRL